ncbi:hypothetical protein CEXT_577161 [Caerostris extrusa]|uniref:Uncharacterized protein n=1 Tax=Caerostris extrusa TaxID=172846 RepID=A0AAV4N458_CAEEX|nr:hypothetical protein CEXT_577161 [Caerostris extrusa]
MERESYFSFISWGVNIFVGWGFPGKKRSPAPGVPADPCFQVEESDLPLMPFCGFRAFSGAARKGVFPDRVYFCAFSDEGMKCRFCLLRREGLFLFVLSDKESMRFLIPQEKQLSFIAFHFCL